MSLNLIRKYEKGDSIQKPTTSKYKFRFDDGEEEFDQKEFEEELLKHPEYINSDEDFKSEFKKDLENKFLKAGLSGGLKISSIGGSELSDINYEGEDIGLGSYIDPKDMSSIKGRKARKQARQSYNREALKNRIYGSSALNLRNRKMTEATEKADAEKIENRKNYLKGFDENRNYFINRYGKHQAGASRGGLGINEAHVIQQNSLASDEDRDKELFSFVKSNYDYLMKADPNDIELSKEISNNYGFDLKEIQEKIKNIDFSTREGNIEFLRAIKNDLSTQFLYDRDFAKKYTNQLLGKKDEEETDVNDTPPTVAPGTTTDDKGNISINENTYELTDDDQIDFTGNKYILGGKNLGYKGFYDIYHKDNPLGKKLQETYPDFLTQTKKIIHGVNSYLIDINQAEKDYGPNSIIPHFRGFSHVLDYSNTMDFFNKNPQYKVVKAANEGIMAKNPYSNISENTYAFIVHNDNGKIKKYKATEEKDATGDITYKYKDDKGVDKVIKTKVSAEQPDNTPFIFKRNYAGFTSIPGVKKDLNAGFSPSLKKGGRIPKFEGGSPIYFKDDNRKVQTNKKAINEKASIGDAISSDYKLSSADILQAGAIMADLGSLGISFIPGASLGAVGAGVAGTSANFAADVQREGVTPGNLASGGINLLLDVATAIPFAGGLAKTAKVAKMLKVATKLLTAAGAGQAALSAAKVASDPANASMDDIHSMVSGLRMIVGGRKQTKNLYDSKSEPVSTFRAKTGDKSAEIKLSKEDVSAINSLPKDQQVQFLKNKAKEASFKEIDLDKIQLISNKRKATASSVYSSVKDKLPFMKGSGKEIDTPVYIKTKNVKTPYNQEEINEFKAQEDKWDFNLNKSNGETSTIRLSPIYKGYKKTFGVPTAGGLQKKLNRHNLEEVGIPMTKGENTKINVKDYQSKKSIENSKVPLDKKEMDNIGEYLDFIKKNPEFKGKSPESIVKALQERSLKDADLREGSAWSKRMREYDKVKKEKQPEIDKLNLSESKRVNDAKKIIDKKNQEVAKDISTRKESRVKAKERLDEYKKKSENKIKESIESNKRKKEIEEYKKKKDDNKKLGREIAKDKAIKKNLEKDSQELEQYTSGRKNRGKIKKAEFGLLLNKPKTSFFEKDYSKSFGSPNRILKAPGIVKPLSFLDLNSSLKSYDRLNSIDQAFNKSGKGFNDKGYVVSKQKLATTDDKTVEKPSALGKIGSSLKNIGSSIDPISLSETGRAIASMIANRGMDTGVSVPYQQNPSEIYQREVGVGATNLANREANRLIGSTSKNLTSDAKLNYQLMRDSENKANAVRERGVFQDLENANRVREINTEKAAQYGNMRSQVASANSAAAAAAENQKRTMGNQIRLANAEVLNTLWAGENARKLQKQETESAYDKYLNESALQSDYDLSMKATNAEYNKVWNDPKSTQAQKNAATAKLNEAHQVAQRAKILGMKNLVSRRGLLPTAKKGGSISDFYKIKKEITKDINSFLKEMRQFDQKKSLAQYKSSLNKKR